MTWTQLDVPTRVGFVASVLAVLGVLVPPISLLSALVAIVFSGIGWQRARRRRESNPVARFCLLGCAALVIVLIVGSAICSASS